MGCNRVLQGKSVLHVLGDPSLTEEAEKEYRQSMVEKALDLLETVPEE